MKADDPLPSDKITVQYQFDFDGQAPGAGGTGTLLVNGNVVAEDRIEKTVPFVFSADETLDVGKDEASPVTSDYPSGSANAFTGEIKWVQIALDDDTVSPHADPAQTSHRILARQ